MTKKHNSDLTNKVTHLKICYIHILDTEGNVYLKRCIASTEFSIFSGESFDLLHQGLCGCNMVVLLPLQSRCQVWNFTSKTEPLVCFHHKTGFMSEGGTTNLFNKSTWAITLSVSSLIFSFFRLLESSSNRALISWRSCVPTETIDGI